MLPLLRGFAGLPRAAAMVELAGSPRAATKNVPTQPTSTARRKVILLRGCVESVIAPNIRAATLRLLERVRYEVIEVADEGCCGALVHHLGREQSALNAARHNIEAWMSELGKGLHAITTTASGCGTTLKNYNFLLRNDPAYAESSAHVSSLAKDISELLAEAGLPAPVRSCDLTIAYHPACSLQHGQAVRDQPRDLLRAAGYKVVEIPESHLCCGSAGTYNIMQPQIASQLRARKVENINKVKPDAIATSNIGCIQQIAGGTDIPVMHIVELLDWATGGPVPWSISS
jgi:glycolate oxidase iron-sulfur subunit